MLDHCRIRPPHRELGKPLGLERTCRILEEDGHQIRGAADGDSGLTLYREAPADVVITDILMPERGGLEVTLALTQEFLDARVIAITGATGARNYLNVATLFGARRVIQKPFTPDEIRRAVRSTLAQ